MINTNLEKKTMPFVKVLKNGVITLPKGVRETLGIHDGEILEVEVNKSRVILKPKLLVDLPDFPIGDELSEKGVKIINKALKSHKKGNSRSFTNVEALIKDLNS